MYKYIIKLLVRGYKDFIKNFVVMKFFKPQNQQIKRLF